MNNPIYIDYNDYRDKFLAWESTMIEEEKASGELVRVTFSDGAEIEVDKDDPYGMPYIVYIGNTCEVFRTLKAATWNLWDEWSQYQWSE